MVVDDLHRILLSTAARLTSAAHARLSFSGVFQAMVRRALSSGWPSFITFLGALDDLL